MVEVQLCMQLWAWQALFCTNSAWPNSVTYVGTFGTWENIGAGERFFLVSGKSKFFLISKTHKIYKACVFDSFRFFLQIFETLLVKER